MNIFQMICFITLAHSSTFHKAAEKLYISQSSFSNNIQTLEKNLGVSLILRGSRGFTLTDAGRDFLVYAEKIVAEYDRMTELLSRYKCDSAKRISIYTDTLIGYAYDSALVRFKLSSPDIQTEISEIKTDRVESMIKKEKNSVYIIFSKQNSSIPNTLCHTLLWDRLALLVVKTHPLAKHKRLSFADLRNETLQMFSRRRSIFVHELTVQQCRNAGFTPIISPYALWYSTMIDTVREFGLTALISEHVAKQMCTPDMRVIELTDSELFSVNVVISDDCTHDAARQFFKFIQKEMPKPEF